MRSAAKASGRLVMSCSRARAATARLSRWRASRMAAAEAPASTTLRTRSARKYTSATRSCVSDSYTPKALKFQILLGLLLPFVVAASLFGHPVWIGVWMVAFFGACSRMLLLTRRLDPSLLPWIPFGCLLRAVALGAGSVAGIAQWIDVILGRKAEA